MLTLILPQQHLFLENFGVSSKQKIFIGITANTTVSNSSKYKVLAPSKQIGHELYDYVNPINKIKLNVLPQHLVQFLTLSKVKDKMIGVLPKAFSFKSYMISKNKQFNCNLTRHFFRVDLEVITYPVIRHSLRLKVRFQNNKLSMPCCHEVAWAYHCRR